MSKLKLKGPKDERITPDVIAAWHACDYNALHIALGLKVWEASPLPDCITELGVCEDETPSAPAFEDSYPKVIKLQRELLKQGGWPKGCRAAYEKNLARAEEDERECAALVKHPDRGGQGTGSDMVSRRRDLKKAREEVAYRKVLLADLEG
ncbi:MAG: hypothetical protein WB037_18650 [Pseudolabrys sp.]